MRHYSGKRRRSPTAKELGLKGFLDKGPGKTFGKTAKNPARKAVRLKNFTGTIRKNKNGTVSIVGRAKGSRRNPASKTVWGVKNGWHAPTGAFTSKRDAAALAKRIREGNRQAGISPGAVKVVKVG